MPTLQLGDVVHLTAGSRFPFHCMSRTYKITKVPVARTGVNYIATPCDELSKSGLEFRRSVKASAACFALGEAEALTSAPRRYVATLNPGTLTTFAGHPGLWVVTGTTSKGSRIFPLGGSKRYYTGVPTTDLTVIDPSKVTIAE
ncbi:hypothetical protein [Tessaracoccus sp.]